MKLRRHLPEHIPPAAWVVIAATLLWWSPTIALRCAGNTASRVRFTAELAAADVLAALGRKDAARRVLLGIVDRSERTLDAVEVERARARRRR